LLTRCGWRLLTSIHVHSVRRREKSRDEGSERDYAIARNAIFRMDDRHGQAILVPILEHRLQESRGNLPVGLDPEHANVATVTRGCRQGTLRIAERHVGSGRDCVRGAAPAKPPLLRSICERFEQADTTGRR
jgi:hypothetical protein